MNFGAFGIMDSIMSVNFVCVCWHYVLEHYAFLPLEHYGVLPPYCALVLNIMSRLRIMLNVEPLWPLFLYLCDFTL